MVRIPYGMQYTATVSGEVVKLVHCESCGHDYGYLMRREAMGSGTSVLFADNAGASERASSRAEEALREGLEKGCDLVPCPACGWYQPNMAAKAKRQKRYWMDVAGAVMLTAMAFVFLGGMVASTPKNLGYVPWLVIGPALGALFMAGVGLLIARRVLNAGYDPNAEDADARKVLGQSRALPPDELEAILRPPSDG